MQYDTDLISPHKDLFLATRKYLLSFSGMIEVKKDRITTYAYKSPVLLNKNQSTKNTGGNICHMRTMSHGIDLGFLKGARMKDDLELLQGKGKAMRVLSLSLLNKDAVKYYVDQAILLNEG
ncbi:hypothetical protein [Kiloniella sp.]|uniref:hypothetical protein n=1 Tax=Kiloniella sp. TaxID=1938587 RepID=UPI003A8DFC94